ncbi:energy transducer TonB [Xenorhabdus bovienii]|uniref:TonB protein (Modular protein) n=1 Tax=Xenorhabdus bovienii TaxID=40576 RepID=A0A0B6XFN1_XENBV|nr:energy transducer TonB [Xenorhabdus bovienii]CDM92101.1 TonB protein (modular protein) [Xenorhabdus bovienii]
MTNTAILERPTNHFPLLPGKQLLVGILIAILLHISLIWLFNRHASYDDSAHHVNQSSPLTGLSITMVAASSWANEPESVSPPPPLITAPESPTKPKIALDKAVQPESRLEKPLESVKPQKHQKPQKEKPQEKAEKKSALSPQVQDSNEELETSGTDQINSQSSMSRAATTQPLVGQGNSALDNYPSRLKQEVESHKRYPRKAKRMKQQGTVTIGFTLLNDGSFTAARVINSSGNSVLDDAALDAIARASSVGPKPADLAPDVTLEIDFELD